MADIGENHFWVHLNWINEIYIFLSYILIDRTYLTCCRFYTWVPWFSSRCPQHDCFSLKKTISQDKRTKVSIMRLEASVKPVHLFWMDNIEYDMNPVQLWISVTDECVSKRVGSTQLNITASWTSDVRMTRWGKQDIYVYLWQFINVNFSRYDYYNFSKVPGYMACILDIQLLIWHSLVQNFPFINVCGDLEWWLERRHQLGRQGANWPVTDWSAGGDHVRVEVQIITLSVCNTMMSYHDTWWMQAIELIC